MRARQPDDSGFVQRGDVSLYYERYGDGSPTVFFLPTWSLVHSRVWKAQIPYLARHFRVVTFDGRGNGRSSRPTDAAAYTNQEFVDDALAVMQATETERAVFVGYSAGARDLAHLAVTHPERVAGALFIGPAVPFGAPLAARTEFSWVEEHAATEGWAKHNRRYWLEHYDDWLHWFAGRLLTEPHSTKQTEDVIGWGARRSRRC